MRTYATLVALSVALVLSAFMFAGCRKQRPGDGFDGPDGALFITLPEPANRDRTSINVRQSWISMMVDGENPIGNSPPSFHAHFHTDEPPQPLEVEYVTVDEEKQPVVVYKPAAEAYERPTAWLYFYGHAPVGRTRRVLAVGHGTTFIIRIKTDEDIVYLLNDPDDPNDDDATVVVTSQVGVHAGDEVTLTVGQMTRVPDDGDCTEPSDYGGIAEHEDFINAVLQEVETEAAAE